MPDPMTIHNNERTIEQDKHMNAVVSKALDKRKKKRYKKADYAKLASMMPTVANYINNASYGAAAGGFTPSVPTDSDNGWSDKKVTSTAPSSPGLKYAGYWSEAFSGLNPLNLYGGAALGGAAALATPTRSLEDQAQHDQLGGLGTALTNLLVPGVGPYRGFKRLGTSIRGPELKEMKEDAQYDHDEEKRQKAEERRAKRNPQPEE